MASSTDIMNMALAFLRANLQVTNLQTDQSIQARIGRTFYPIKRDEYMTWRPWGFCKNTGTLSFVAQNPTPVWAFSYQDPSDDLMPRRILGVTANSVGTLAQQTPSNAIVDIGSLYAPQVDTRQSAIRFELAKGLILTNMPNAILEYTQSGIPEGMWPSKFVLALAYGLAEMIAPSLTDGDEFKLGQSCGASAKRYLEEAAAQDLNKKMQIEPDAEVIRRRGGF